MKIITLTFIAFFTISCSSTKTSQSKINSIEVSEKLIKGKTSQTQVIENFGAPDVVERSPEGDMWAYNRRSNEAQSVSTGITHYIAAAGFWNWTGASLDGSKSSDSTHTASLVLYFGKDKKLKTYTYRTERF
jgi:hypothetical protein